MSKPDESRLQRDADETVLNSQAAADETILETPGEDGPPPEYAEASASYAGARSAARQLAGKFGRYRIEKPLGQGAMGAVYLATDTQLDRSVALKVPFFNEDDGPDVIDRFYREARAMATLHHPNLCPVHDVGEIDGLHYLTMAFIDGHPLSDYLKKDKPLPAKQVAAVARKLALSLHEAHEAGIVHRDLKPANIMIDKRNEPIIMDFGLAQRRKENEKELTQSGAILGSPAYMSPEQVEADQDKIGPCTDVYALGVIIYRMICGKLPFEGSMALVLGKIVMQPPAPPSEVHDKVDKAIEAICLKAMAKRIEDRYESARALARDLGKFMKGQLPGAVAISDVVESELEPLGETPQAQQQQAGEGSVTVSEKSTDRLTNELFDDLVAAEQSSTGAPLQSSPLLQPPKAASRSLFAKLNRLPKPAWIATGAGLALIVVLVIVIASIAGDDPPVDGGMAESEKTARTDTNPPTPSAGENDGTVTPERRTTSTSGVTTPATSQTPIQSSAAAPPRATITPADGWVSLMPLVRLKDNSPANIVAGPDNFRQGKWSRTGDDLHAESEVEGSHLGCRLPVEIAGSYEVRATITPSSNNLTGLLLPVGNRRFRYSVGPSGGGVEYIDGKNVISGENPTRHERPIELGQRYGVLLRVVQQGDQVELRAFLNDEQLPGWQGPVSSLWDGYDHGDSWQKCIILGAVPPTATVFHTAELRMLSGEATLLRPADARSDVSPAATTQREAAQILLKTCDRVDVQLKSNGSTLECSKVSDLPAEPFQVTGLSMRRLDGWTDNDIDRLAGQLTSLKYAQLYPREVTDSTLRFLEGAAALESYDSYGNNKVTGRGLAHLRSANGLTQLATGGAGVTDDDLRHFSYLEALKLVDGAKIDGSCLQNMPNLTKLELIAAEITDSTLEKIEKRSKLMSVNLDRCRQVTDKGILCLTRARDLTFINLMGCTQVTDEGLVHLSQLKKLREVYLAETGVTNEGVAKLREALPECQVHE